MLKPEDLPQRRPQCRPYLGRFEAAFWHSGRRCMQLKDKVGRVAANGRSCQNWKKDQELVISLLNKIAISDGGAENTLNPPLVVTGHASDGLYASILYFQKNNF